MSVDIQSLKKDSLDKSKSNVGRFYPNVYLYGPSATEKVLCNALLILKEELHPSKTVAIPSDIVSGAFPAFTTTPSAEAKKYDHGEFLTQDGDVIVNNIKYLIPVDKFDYFEGIFKQFNFF